MMMMMTPDVIEKNDGVMTIQPLLLMTPPLASQLKPPHKRTLTRSLSTFQHKILFFHTHKVDTENSYHYTKVFQCDMSTLIYYTNSLTNKYIMLKVVVLLTQVGECQNYSRAWSIYFQNEKNQRGGRFSSNISSSKCQCLTIFSSLFSLILSLFVCFFLFSI